MRTADTTTTGKVGTIAGGLGRGVCAHVDARRKRTTRGNVFPIDERYISATPRRSTPIAFASATNV
jgi:hypothetical protein